MTLWAPPMTQTTYLEAGCGACVLLFRPGTKDESILCYYTLLPGVQLAESQVALELDQRMPSYSYWTDDWAIPYMRGSYRPLASFPQLDKLNFKTDRQALLRMHHKNLDFTGEKSRHGPSLSTEDQAADAGSMAV